ncbi:efflux RND transporter permease subunit [Nitrosomonas sp. Nm33]|uniref:efflux RND transporter permease subunit n=1 Tax=Nitrosomonas sp. Nm33 TaxID=133724 RepID=UPI00089B5F61|nr:CusA/CzcA family heavy metal efflux RND transporter [Nitrosomonas sp. Nm33]SDY36723.1 cobalt-zinc-cadmium resistance protein CzcA [Nitrosomonas sp. Nm33]
MITRVIAFCLQQHLIIIGASLLLIALGIRSFERLPVQAFPDVQNVFVQVVTQYPGQAPEEVEKLISLPIERAMNGLPHLLNMRSVSIFGLSVVTLTFDDTAEDYFSRQQVLERLRGIHLPADVTPLLGPLTTGIGEIYRYLIEAPETTLIEQRAIQDWTIEPMLRSVPGVADVVGFGGGIKQYQIQIDPHKLKNYKLTLPEVYQAIAASNANIGGSFIEHGDEALVVRGTGLLQSVDDIKEIVVSTREDTPVFVKNIAEVIIGPQTYSGIVGYNKYDNVVQGIVLLIKGKNAIEVLNGVKEKINHLNHYGLPPGVKIIPIYDRTDLVQKTVHTVERNMLEGIALVLVIILIFLRRILASLVIIIVIPLSLLFAFILIDIANVSANLISLGAIDFGILVDSAVVMVEAVMVKMTLEMRQHMSVAHMRQSMLITAGEMARPILFTKTIIIVAMIPVFTFQQVEGKIFSPMALTISFALAGALIISLTLIPVLLSYFIGPKLIERHNPLVHSMQQWYQKLLEAVLRHSSRLFMGASLALALSLASIPWIGTEFMPKLDEGNIWLTITMPTSVSLRKAKELETDVRMRLLEFPEASSVLTQLGRPEDGTDPKGFNNIEVLIDLKPKSAWRYASKDELIKRMKDRLAIFPGMQFNFSQVIQDNVEEAISGVKGEIAIKIFGPNLKILQEKANKITHILRSTEGATDVAAEQQAGLSQMVITINRAKIARYGINIADVENVIAMAIGGKAATQMLEGERLFDITVRLISSARDSVGAIENITVLSSDGSHIPLAELADIRINQGASRITREGGMRRIAIKCNLIGRDQGSFVREAQKKIAEQVVLQPGYRTVWSGQFENQQRAMKRLSFIVPLSLTMIFLLLFWAFLSIRNAFLIVSIVPFAMIGGLITLLLTGIHLSISAAVGFIVLFGIAVQNGIILVSHVNALRREGMTISEAVLQGSVDRLRPILMTALMAMLGLLPAALSTGVGSETAKPFAVVIIGGLITATISTLTLLPALYHNFDKQHNTRIS